MRSLAALLALLAAMNVHARAAQVALLVHDKDDAPVLAALRAEDALSRATAARVVLVRGVTAALPALRELVANESDPSALREQLRALVLLGDDADLDRALSASRSEVVAEAVARRGGARALDAYFAKLRTTGPTHNFFLLALWGHPELVPAASSRLLILSDARGWKSLLDALIASELALPADHAVKGLASRAEEIRSATAWYLAVGYAIDPAKIPEPLRRAILEDASGISSDREDFGREILRRMLGTPQVDADRWLRWLATSEADETLANAKSVLSFMTPAELAVRKSHCATARAECPFTASGSLIPSTAVVPPDFSLPGTLPPGLTADLIAATRCRDSWLGVAQATVDNAGRVQSLQLRNVTTSCAKTLSTIVRLSLASNYSITSNLTSGNILLVKPAGMLPCLDETADEGPVYPVGGDVTPPVVKKRVEPEFPMSAREKMVRRDVIIILETVISKSGCIRSVNLVTQSPFPELNGAAVMSIAKWTFDPARKNGVPVASIFRLTLHFAVS